MDTLPRLKTWTCERCQNPIDVWDWDLTTPLSEDDSTPKSLCLECALPLRPAEWCEGDRVRAEFMGQARAWLHNPPATIIAIEETIGDRAERPGKGPYPGVLFMVAAKWWRTDWPQDTMPLYSDEARDERCPHRLAVVLGALVTDEWKPNGGCWLFHWSWQDPTERERCEILPPYAPIAQSLADARAAFIAYQQAKRGRPEKSESQAHAELMGTVERFKRERGCQPNIRDKDFAAYMGVGRTQLYERLDRAGLGPWSNFKQRHLIPICNRRRVAHH